MSAGPLLLNAMLMAPLVGTAKRDPRTLHAVDHRELAAVWPRKSTGKRVRLPVAACGVKSIWLRDGCGEAHMIPWPPRVKSLPTGYVRCPSCQAITGNMRPRSQFTTPSRPSG